MYGLYLHRISACNTETSAGGGGGGYKARLVYGRISISTYLHVKTSIRDHAVRARDNFGDKIRGMEMWYCRAVDSRSSEISRWKNLRIYRARRQPDGFLFRGNSRTWSSNTRRRYVEAKIRENREVARLRIIDSHRIPADVGFYSEMACITQIKSNFGNVVIWGSLKSGNISGESV